ncbi:hypothetical protein F4808DRAFT_436904 [Astrocystis sublimbata]|nr:hypothetical protein F4808DRAFT_436904 [Astrocystis sublimbata]
MSKMNRQPLLDEETDNVNLCESDPAHPTRPDRFCNAALITNAILLTICLLLGFTVLLLPSSSKKQQEGLRGSISDPYSPENTIVEYEYRQMIGNDTRFTGHPGPEWEKSMHDVMTGTLIRISDDERKLLNSNSIPLKDGGYAAGLGVAHNLHCIKQIKKFLYRDQFYAEIDPNGADFAYLLSHADHCLDFLRQSIMCHLDFTVYTLYWGENTEKPTHRAPGLQKCVKWETLHGWMSGRQARTDMLVGP